MITYTGGHTSGKELLRKRPGRPNLLWSEGSVQNRVRLFSVVISDRTRISGQNQKHRIFLLNHMKCVTVSLMGHWNWWSRDTVPCCSLEIFKSHLNLVLGSHLQVALLEQGGLLDQMNGSDLFQPQLFCDSVFLNFYLCRQDKTTQMFALIYCCNRYV